ncbi:MAG: 3-phosphoshikimate 1-carboxyvinyltransferase [Bacillota bacterium]
MIIITAPPEKFSGELNIPGDKSITHRAAMLGALARGITEIHGYLNAEDCRSTFSCLKSLGVKINTRGGRLFVEGRNMALKSPSHPLEAGNSGTTARLLLGILAGQPFSATITGDQSLRKRPMKRVVEPLRLMGASITAENDDDYLPLTINGANLQPLDYESPRASAQVKSAILLAGLYTEGITTVEEPYRSRNHTELMLSRFGASVKIEGCKVALQGRPILHGTQINIPGDISTAAFFMVAAAIMPGSELLLKNVGVNPTRSGIIDILNTMGAEIELQNKRDWGGEPAADILVRGGSRLKAASLSGEIIPLLIDEIPILAVAASVAEGKTVISGASELRVKESDRISALSGQLIKLGAAVEETEDGLIIEGKNVLRGAEVESYGDHRIAMSLAVAGLVAKGETVIHGAEAINISYPGFMPALRSLTK